MLLRFDVMWNIYLNMHTHLSNDKYEILDKLGSGSFGDIYEGKGIGRFSGEHTDGGKTGNENRKE